MNETCAIAEVFFESGCNWETTRKRTIKDNIMGKEKISTTKRLFSLIKQRIETLDKSEQKLLKEGSNSEKRLILLLAICKAHTMIFDFIAVNVRDCFYNMSEKVTHANFNEFFNEKKYVHPELETITDLTQSKIRQVIFRILELCWTEKS